MYEDYQNENNEMKGQDQQVNEPLPMYGQVDGQKIYMGGLDYSLLKKQKQQQNKNGLLSNIKNKLFNMQSKIDSRIVKPTPNKPIDEQSIKLITTLKNLENIKPSINSSTYYIFDTRYQFGRLNPQIITKRFGRMNKQASYIKLSGQTITKFQKLLQKPRLDIDKLNKDNAIRKLAQNNQSSSQQSDNIFGSDEDQQPKEENKPNNKLFSFGQKLNLGVNDDDIFNTKIQENKLNNNIDIQKQQIEQQKDKYQFLRKKVKKTLNQGQLDDGYGQCYIQSGPSFEQMKQYKNLGIQLFGDLKQFKKVQKKTNINKQYHMVKKIIDQKNKQSK